MKKLVPSLKLSSLRPGSPSPTEKSKTLISSKAAAKAPRWVNIDYPRPSEKVQKGHYAIRVHAPWATETQISIDGMSWQDCRSDVGFFWHDWHPSASGAKKINARSRNGAGAWTKAETRECEVE